MVLNADEGVEAPAGTRLITASDVARTDVAGAAARRRTIPTSPTSSTRRDRPGRRRASCSRTATASRSSSGRSSEFSVSADDRLSSHAPLHFDLSTFDLFAAALAGAPVVLVPPETSLFPAAVRRFIELNEITIWYSVPSILSMLAARGGLSPGDLPRLRRILFAGEVFPTKYLRRLMELLPHVRFANLYGPTETNVCTWYEVPTLPEEMTEAIPIGKAIAGVEVFAVTEAGAVGRPRRGRESSTCRGRPSCRATGPIRSGPRACSSRTRAEAPAPQRAYRTGDLVQEMEDGNYRFLGRRDTQIKSRGYRVELGDVEAALYAHPAVDECAVVAVPDELVTNRIKAYVATRDAVSKAEPDLVLRGAHPRLHDPRAVRVP